MYALVTRDTQNSAVSLKQAPKMSTLFWNSLLGQGMYNESSSSGTWGRAASTQARINCVMTKEGVVQTWTRKGTIEITSTTNSLFWMQLAAISFPSGTSISRAFLFASTVVYSLRQMIGVSTAPACNSCVSNHMLSSCLSSLSYINSLNRVSTEQSRAISPRTSARSTQYFQFRREANCCLNLLGTSIGPWDIWPDACSCRWMLLLGVQTCY